MRRSRTRRRRHEGVSAEPDWEARQPARPAGPPGLALDLVQMLETLDEEDRAMLILKYAKAYDYEELAAIFEISVSACKMRISRAREKLQLATKSKTLLQHKIMKDFLEQLAEMPLGDVPAEFDHQLHGRLNRALLMQHIVELLTGAVPWAVLAILPRGGRVCRLHAHGQIRQRPQAGVAARQKSCDARRPVGNETSEGRPTGCRTKRFPLIPCSSFL